MKKYKYEDFQKGWFIGPFENSVFKTNAFEIAIKYYEEGESEKKHFHKIATEYTLIVYGKVRMNDQIFEKGDLIEIEPNYATDFKALTKTCTAVVKMPGVLGDKYLYD